MPSRSGYHFLNQKLGHVLRKDLRLRNIWEVVFISNHKEPFTLITKFRAVTSPVGRRGLCASFGIGGGSTAGRVFPGIPGPALSPFSLEAQTWPCSPCGNSRMGNHASSWPLECQRYHLPVAHLALCIFSPQVKSHSLRWTFKGPAVGVSNATWAPEARLGRRVTPARLCESYHPGQLSVWSLPAPPAAPSLRAPAPLPLRGHQQIPPCASSPAGAVTPRAVTSGTPCSPGPASGHAPALPAPSSGGGGHTHPFLRLVCGKAPLPLPSQERK